VSTDDTPEVIMVPVKRYDVTLSLDQILAPLTQTAANLQAAGLVDPAAPDSEVAKHLQTFTDLVSQLKDVTGQIDGIDSSLLASKPGPPPAPPTPPEAPTT
jgi:hypothetical protein